MKEVLIQEYSSSEILRIPHKEPKNDLIVNFNDGPFVEVLGPKTSEYKIAMGVKNDDILEPYYTNTVNNNMWTKGSRKYYTPWHIQVWEKVNDQFVKIYDEPQDLKDKTVYITLDSRALGDTLAWFPYVEEFRKKHECKVICSTFHNSWFKETYPEITFVPHDTQLHGVYAHYNIGWFYNEESEVDYNKIPIDFKTKYLGETASSILGLEPTEIKPKIHLEDSGPNIKGKYVCIAPHASSHAKYWLYEDGWQEVIKYLNQKGYKVVLISQEPLNDEWHDSKLNSTMKGLYNKSGDLPIEDRMIDIKYADAFIGVGSGLSWLAWALETPVVMISGFSDPISEFATGVERIYTPENKCRGCFNTHRLDASNWEWCPLLENTERQFECSKSITPDTVISAFNKAINMY